MACVKQSWVYDANKAKVHAKERADQQSKENKKENKNSARARASESKQAAPAPSSVRDDIGVLTVVRFKVIQYAL